MGTNKGMLGGGGGGGSLAHPRRVGTRERSGRAVVVLADRNKWEGHNKEAGVVRSGGNLYSMGSSDLPVRWWAFLGSPALCQCRTFYIINIKIEIKHIL